MSSGVAKPAEEWEWEDENRGQSQIRGRMWNYIQIVLKTAGQTHLKSEPSCCFCIAVGHFCPCVCFLFPLSVYMHLQLLIFYRLLLFYVVLQIYSNLIKQIQIMNVIISNWFDFDHWLLLLGCSSGRLVDCLNINRIWKNF